VATAGDYIREARQGRGWNQSELAERVSASTTTVSNWERGITKPGLDDINALCSALGLSADVLLGKLGVTLTPPAEARLPRAGSGSEEDAVGKDCGIVCSVVLHMEYPVPYTHQTLHTMRTAQI